MTSPKKVYFTPSGLPVEPCYCGSGKITDEMPGEFPFTRGIHKSMYRDRLWTMRQYAGFGTAKETNERFRYLLQEGTTGLSVAFDLPTQMGLDPDSPLSNGEVGRVGVSVSTVRDFEILFDNISLRDVSISMTINATAPILLAFLLVVAEKQGVGWRELRGTTQNDILKEYIARGTYIFPPKEALRLVTDVFEFCAKNVTQWNTISISGYHIREAGSTAVQELAFTFADAIVYVEEALKKGLDINEFGSRITFFFNCHNDFLEEIAKFRAARRIWAKIMKEKFGATNPKAWLLRFHTQTAGSSLTAVQPLNNVVRTTIQAMAAALGGTQSLHTNSFDEALGLPTVDSAMVALRTQQIIAHESGIAAAADPLGGSYLIENFTDRIEKETNALLAKIDGLGGMLRAIEVGFPQQEIERSAYEYQRRVESGDQIVVGVNEFRSQTSEPKVLKLDPKGEDEARKELASIKSSRDNMTVNRLLTKLSDSIREGSNVMPLIVDCARNMTTLGEISDCFRNIWGEFRGQP